jgi:hypothetical protein
MACYAGCWVGVFMLAFLAMALSGVPKELFQAPASTLPLPAQAAPQDAVAPAPTPAEGEMAPVDAEGERSPADQDRVVRQWLSRAWPIVGLVVLLVLAAGAWLYGGQIGYLTARLRGQPATVATFFSSGTTAFWPVLGSSLFSLVITAGVVLVIALVAWLLSALPTTAAGIVGVVLVAAGVVALVWVLVRMMFWFIAVVADRRGPLAGLRASVEATRGKWWKTFGLLALLMVIGMGAAVTFNLLAGLGTVLGGPVGTVLQVVVTILQLLIVNLYLGFASTAALICFYEDAKAPTAPQS